MNNKLNVSKDFDEERVKMDNLNQVTSADYLKGQHGRKKTTTRNALSSLAKFVQHVDFM